MKRKTTKLELPPGVLVSDTKYPPYSARKPWPEVVDHLTFYQVTGLGWCIATLHIRNASHRQPIHTAARTYAITLDGRLVRVGLGPHVTSTVRVIVFKHRQAALQKYLDLKQRGEVEANTVRDRLSTRRMRSAQRDPADVLSRFMFGK